ncbi:MAG: hypothetical protein IJ088_13005, partial [Clostridia bacterium]|nr:hypothetical protein [Clostridia bacterium]
MPKAKAALKRILLILGAALLSMGVLSYAAGEGRQGGGNRGMVHGYVREESVQISGGTTVSVFSGVTDSATVDPYLEAPGDYLAYSLFRTRSEIISTSNITASTNFTQRDPGTPDGFGKTGRNGVGGVSWDNESNTLILDHARGTVILINGPELHVDQLNTYNDKLKTIIDVNEAGLVRYVQKDVFGGSPHTKANQAAQDTVNIRLIGSNQFREFHFTGNVRIVFEGDGELTLQPGDPWLYDQPGFEQVSVPSGTAFSSGVITGFQGVLASTETDTGGMPNGMERTIEETFAYVLPSVQLAENMAVTEGGRIIEEASAPDGPVDLYRGGRGPFRFG